MPIVGLTEILAVNGRQQIARPEELKVKVAQSCPMDDDPMDYTVHGILQARILKCVAFPYSRGSSQRRDQAQASHNEVGFFSS